MAELSELDQLRKDLGDHLAWHAYRNEVVAEAQTLLKQCRLAADNLSVMQINSQRILNLMEQVVMGQKVRHEEKDEYDDDGSEEED